MINIKLENVGRKKQTVRIYGADSLNESSMLKTIIETRTSQKPMRIGDSIPAWKFYDTVNSYKVTNICYDGSIELKSC